MTLIQKIKKSLRKLLKFEKKDDYVINVRESLSLKNAQLKNDFWERGQPSELSQLFSNINFFDTTSFWAKSAGFDVRKIHTGMPSLIVNTLTNIVVSDIYDIDVDNDNLKDIWEDIEKDNNFTSKILRKAIKQTLVMGDGAFKISYNAKLSSLPIIEFYRGYDVDYKYSNGKLNEIIFHTHINKTVGDVDSEYILLEYYGHGYIKYELYDKNYNRIELSVLDETKDLEDVYFITGKDENGNYIYDNIMLAVKFEIWDSDLYDGRGKSIFDGKDSAFDMIDEVISQWVDDIRKGRTKQYIPEQLIPKDENGKLVMKSNFVNEFIKTNSSRISDMGTSPEISVIQPDIRVEAYSETYNTALDFALQGIISPSSLGIDVKKLDNAESQREKEKVTLNTRAAIISALSDSVKELVRAVIKSYLIQNNKPDEDFEVSIVFGEYANPSFEAIVETMSKAKTAKIMSNELIVEEIWGKSKTDEEKKAEIERLNKLDNVDLFQEPNFLDDTNNT